MTKQITYIETKEGIERQKARHGWTHRNRQTIQGSSSTILFVDTLSYTRLAKCNNTLRGECERVLSASLLKKT